MVNCGRKDGGEDKMGGKEWDETECKLLEREKIHNSSPIISS